MFRIIATAAFIALTVTAANAGSVTVNIKDLDLTNPAASQALAARIQTAAETACGPAAEPLDNRPSMQAEAASDHRACVRRSAQAALTSIQAQPRLARAAAVVKLASN
jgi:UrcA family protein